MSERIDDLTRVIAAIVSDTNGISINNTILLLLNDPRITSDQILLNLISSFYESLLKFQYGQFELFKLLRHPVAQAFYDFFKNFPLSYREDHIHLTGSLTSEFIYPKLISLLNGPHGAIYKKKIKDIYGEEGAEINSVKALDRLIRLRDNDRFEKYLQILLLAKIVLVDREAHKEAAYHLAKTLSQDYNIGRIKLKFTYSRASSLPQDQLPHGEPDSDEVVLGLFDGFMMYKKENPKFNFVLSPCFRKEAYFYDSVNYKSKLEHFSAQVNSILKLLERYPELSPYLTEVDTVGDEKELYRKGHFDEMRLGFRKLAFKGFVICSHHGETWQTLKQGVQAVDNAMNIWHISTLEHGLSLGINPNFYYHSLFQRVLARNNERKPISITSSEGRELAQFPWTKHTGIRDKLLVGERLSQAEEQKFTKIKFHHAREVEHYQHDVLNRMIDKDVHLTALPSSNKRLTDYIKGYEYHPFSWWEKKGVNLKVGTDNYVTLNTDYIREMLILLFSDPELKITKLLMVTTGEARRPYLSNLLWTMKEKFG